MSARTTLIGLMALQHRGQESAGVAVLQDGRIGVSLGMGRVDQIFRPDEVDALTGIARHRPHAVLDDRQLAHRERATDPGRVRRSGAGAGTQRQHRQCAGAAPVGAGAWRRAGDRFRQRVAGTA